MEETVENSAFEVHRRDHREVWYVIDDSLQLSIQEHVMNMLYH